MSTAVRAVGLALALLVGLQAASQAFAWSFQYSPALGPALRLGEGALYWPWSILVWRAAWPDLHHEYFSLAIAAFTLAVSAVLIVMAAISGPGVIRRRCGWGNLWEAARAGLRDGAGCILGEMGGRILATTDLRPTLVTGGTRSGKGRGHVVPTLLSWTDSVLVHDPKGELWRVTAGWRSTFSHTLNFSPRDLASARFNPLAEIRPGPQELAQVQRLVSILSDPGGVRDDEAIWDKAASEILEAVVLHVLYVADDEAKTLLTVRSLLVDLDATAQVMARTLHRRGPGGDPEVHPFIAAAARGYGTMHDRFRTSVQGTARSYLKWLVGEDLERSLSASDFRLGDLMCAPHPVSLYVQISPADGAALKPLVRLLFYAAALALTAQETKDDAGRPKRFKLLMLMDEFPLLGRVAFFEKSLRLMSGFGIKTMFVAQSLNDIVETYGPHNTILDNCHVYTAFSALDPLTQDKVSKLTGTVLETKTSHSGPAGLSGGRSSVSRSQVERPLLEPGEVRALPDDVQLTFAAGHRPLRTRKLRYDQRRPFRNRADLPPPDQAARVDTPERPPHPWAGRRSLGENPAHPPSREGEATGDENSVVEPAGDHFEHLAHEIIAQEKVLDKLHGESGGAR